MAEPSAIERAWAEGEARRRCGCTRCAPSEAVTSICTAGPILLGMLIGHERGYRAGFEACREACLESCPSKGPACSACDRIRALKPEGEG